MTNKKTLSYKEVWDTLRAVDCSKVIENKMGLDYIVEFLRAARTLHCAGGG